MMWRSEVGGGESAQVYPVDDLKEHVVSGRVCWCEPEYDVVYDVVIHNSMDQREKFETGKRKPS